MQDFTVITLTGDRPQPFELCAKFVLRQTVRPTQWLIVDDGQVPTTPPAVDFVDYVRRERSQYDPEHTLTVQMYTALDRVKTDRVIIVEDDDWYCDTYFERMLALFDVSSKPELVGQGNAVYYHVGQQSFYRHFNNVHASLCQTGFTRDLYLDVMRLCQGCDPFLDVQLWREVNVRKHLDLSSPEWCIGIKGMPGREGTTMGWRRPWLFMPDKDCKELRALVGGDAELYMEFKR